MIIEKVAALTEAQVAATMATLKGSKKHRVAKKALGVYARQVRRNRRRLSKQISPNLHAPLQEVRRTRFWGGIPAHAKAQNAALFLAVLLHVGLASFLGVLSRVKRMASGRVGMMCGFLMVSAIVMLGRFAVMAGSVLFYCA